MMYVFCVSYFCKINMACKVTKYNHLASQNLWSVLYITIPLLGFHSSAVQKSSI